MLRRLYVWLLRLHPAGFRERFGEEILGIFDSEGPGSRGRLMADMLASLFRQWALRSDHRAPELIPATPSGPGPAPLFRTIEPFKLRPSAYLPGGLLTLALVLGLIALMGKGVVRRPLFLIGSHHPRPNLLGVDRGSVAESELGSTVSVGREPEDPWRPLALVYFRAIRVLSVLDGNQDLAISPWEMITAPSVLRRLDVDHDGKLTASECGLFHGVTAGLEPGFLERASREFMRNNPVLAALDRNHDGVITYDEIDASPQSLKTLDRNRDGSLSPQELIPEQTVVQAAMIFARLDINGDGVISAREATSEEAEPLRGILERADHDHDGRVTRQELQLQLRMEKARRDAVPGNGATSR